MSKEGGGREGRCGRGVGRGGGGRGSEGGVAPGPSPRFGGWGCARWHGLENRARGDLGAAGGDFFSVGGGEWGVHGASTRVWRPGSRVWAHGAVAGIAALVRRGGRVRCVGGEESRGQHTQRTRGSPDPACDVAGRAALEEIGAAAGPRGLRRRGWEPRRIDESQGHMSRNPIMALVGISKSQGAQVFMAWTVAFLHATGWPESIQEPQCRHRNTP